MTGVFVDTVGLLALLDEDDQWHQLAEKAWRASLASGFVPYTSTFVMLECGNAVSRRDSRTQVDTIRQRFEHARRLIWPTDDEWREAWKIYASRRPGDAGIVDHVSFIIMRRLKITDAFTNDKHFKAAGFHTLF